MKDFLVYEAKVAIALLVFAILYRLLLRKETFHSFNRFVILGTSLLAFILPLCVLVRHVSAPVATELNETMLPVGMGAEAENAGSVAVTNFDWSILVLGAVFCFGVAIVLVRIIHSIILIYRLIASGAKIPQEDGKVIVVVEDKDFSPISWMKYIVISSQDYSSTDEAILIHERAHIALGHSWDILLFDLMTVMQWFNPAIWLLKADLRAIHEYEADETVVAAGTDVRKYQLLLVNKAMSHTRYQMANSLNHSTLKNRILMMDSKKSSLCGALKALYIIPFVMVSLALNAETKYDSIPSVGTTEIGTQDMQTPPAGQEVAPVFSEGDFFKWVNFNLLYPKDARKDNIEGMVYISFVVGADGVVKDVKAVKSDNPLLEAAVVKLVSSSPKWTPGYNKDGEAVDVSFAFPVKFVIRGSASAQKKNYTDAAAVLCATY